MRFTIKQLFLGIAAFAVVLGLLKWGSVIYYMEYHDTLALLKEIGADCVSLQGFDDGPNYEVVSVTLSLQDRPDTRVTLWNPSDTSSDCMQISRLGGWSFAAVKKTPDFTFHQNWVDVGRLSPLRDHLPVPMNGASDIVNRYDEWTASLGALPEELRTGKAEVFEDGVRCTYEYRITRVKE